ncbi:MAG: ABC transporter ATP-binding protein, partial [Leptospiraceae bacterium]|nr:ABC transporter ATP-binding protein [Leptospiraceae bacterium]
MSSTSAKNDPILSVRGLSLGFTDEAGVFTGITDNVSFDLAPGEVLGLVGESGCGKTITALSILGLLPRPGARITSGQILFKGKDLLQMSADELRRIRGNDISMIFQEPTAALNPLMRIGDQLLEVYDYHPEHLVDKSAVRQILERVGIADPDRILTAWPHELSG